MIYISAQPDSYYFLWQLQLQLYNFKSKGIPAENIHVLIGYDPSVGLSPDFKEFINRDDIARFFTYPDERQRKGYVVSQRHHIIAKHFKLFPSLQQEVIFLHDSDIIFRELPNFSSLSDNDIWYASDTQSYLNVEYIERTAGNKFFLEMCDVVGINNQAVLDNNKNAGGAQYLFKNVSSKFWEKIEEDCEKMYDLLTSNNAKYPFCDQENVKVIQDWCSEMWVIWWNSLLFGKTFEISEELDFCWAQTPINDWYKSKILHYTGVADKNNLTVFNKNNYIHHSPFDDDFTNIKKKYCSYPLIEEINQYVQYRNTNRTDLVDLTVMIFMTVRLHSEIDAIATVTKYLNKHFKLNINLVVLDRCMQELKIPILPENVDLIVLRSQNKDSLNEFLSVVVNSIRSPFCLLLTSPLILSERQLYQGLKSLRENMCETVLFRGNILIIDSLLTTMFEKLLEYDLFEANQNKLNMTNGTLRDIVFCQSKFLKSVLKIHLNDASTFQEATQALSNTESVLIYHDQFYHLGI